MSNTIYSFIIAAMVGVLLAIQPIFNTNVGKAVGMWNSALISLSLSAIIMMTISAFNKFEGFKRLIEVPNYFFTAGLMGAFIVVSSVYCISRIGPVITISISVSAQMMTALVCEHFGWFNVQQTSINVTRILGIVFLILGVILVKSKAI